MTAKSPILLLILICFAVPGSANIDSARSNIIALADKGNLTEMDSAIDKLISDNASSSLLNHNLLIIADSLTWRRLTGRAERLYQIVIDKSSDDSMVIKARLGLKRNMVLRLIGDKKYSAAQELTDSMTVTFKSEPDLAAALFQIGQEFSWQRRYIEAGEAFNKGISLFPNSPASKEMKLWSARVEICSLLGKLNTQQSTDDEIITAIDKMIVDFQGDNELPKAVQWICKEYEWIKGTSEDRTAWFDKPNSVYQRLTQKFSDNPYGQQAEFDQKRLKHRMKIYNLLAKADQAEIDAAIEAMVSEFKGRPELAGELRWIATGYEENPATMLKAKDLYDRIAREYPGTVEANDSVLDSRRIDIDALFKADNDSEAQLLLEKYVQDFNTNGYAGPCLKSMAWGFRNEVIESIRLNQPDRAGKYFERALKIWNIMLDKLPSNPSSTPESLYFIGETYSRMGQCEKGIPYLKRVVLEWPNYQFVSKADTDISVCLGKNKNK
jgi:tetratricopeptide (TPR) repeat protein